VVREEREINRGRKVLRGVGGVLYTVQGGIIHASERHNNVQ
jgi:hypothetical protein